jgi:hypothetical protein
MKFRVLLLAVFCALIASCSDEDVQRLPEAIANLSTKSLVVESGAEVSFEFDVVPADAYFNYTVSDKACQVSLQANASYIALKKVEPVSGIAGRYKATIKDTNRSDNYQMQFAIRIVNDDFTEVISENIDVAFSGNKLFSFAFLKEVNNGAVMQDFDLEIKSNYLTVASPLISNPQLIATFETNAAKVLVNGVEQVSGVTKNDFSSPVTYEFVSASGRKTTMKVNVDYSGLPVLVIETPNQATIPSKHYDWLKNTTITLYNADGTVNYEGSTSIRGRGNSTWGYPKKPYNLKLDEKAEILGMPKHKRWSLLANWMDRTLLRNRVAFEIASYTDMDWNPSGEFVEVILNGKHIGNYLLCEHIKVDKNRVNIHELEEGDIDGGYIMELDVYYDETYKFKSAIRQLPYMFKDPDEVNEQQIAFMQNFINELEASLYDDAKFAKRDYLNYMDIDSYIDWWFVHELARNWEPNHPKSTYMYKDKGGKLHAGPVWDFDWETFTPNNWFVLKDALYYKRLFEDPEFVKRVKERWTMLKPGFDKVVAFIDEEAKRIAPSEKMNHPLWPINQTVNRDESLSFDDAVKRMKEAYETKLSWLDKAIKDM